MDTLIAIACLGIAASVFCQESFNTCNLESMGCFKDKDAPERTLPELLVYDRDVQHSKGKTIDWKHFKAYLNDLGCRCAEAAAKKGYDVIGLQFYGECWSGPNKGDAYSKYGPGKCVDGNFEESDNTGCNELTVGKQWSNAVYRIRTPGCNQKFKHVGCFNDDLKSPRPLPHYLLNERDPSIPNWDGKVIDWKNWDTYSAEFICRCAEKARSRGDVYFSLQFYGECWSKKEDDSMYERNGISTSCVDEHYHKCHCNDYICIGKKATNSVYKLLPETAKDAKVSRSYVKYRQEVHYYDEKSQTYV